MERNSRPAGSEPASDLLAARGGDELAASRLVADHGAGMLRSARRVLGGESGRDAEDAVQEAFLAALVTAALPTADVGAWLRAIAARKALDLARRRSRRGEVALPGEGAGEPSVAPDGPGMVDAGTVRRALEKLAPVERAVLVLVDLEGLTMAEAAAMLGASRVATKVRAMRARRKLAGLLGAVPRAGD